jgi:SpoVK/Ycf46/Vps4 family AAA+-type ATPase
VSKTDATPNPALDAVRAAVDADPENVELRAHLASLLLMEGDALSARQEAELVLAKAPDHREVLGVAAEAAEQLGDMPAAAGYRRLQAALAQLSTPPSAELPTEKAKDESEPIRLHAVRDKLRAGRGSIEGNVSEVERPAVKLEDVGGMENVKRRLRTAFLAPLENPALRRMYGMSLRGGLLLYGPPGCGKTFIARATAGELGARFIGVGLHDVLDMWLGQSERNLHELFEGARRAAPCVLFFDEADALGRKRSQLTHSAGREVVVQFLSELDSFGTENEGVFVLAATNHPWDVDAALRRPGRFDRMILVLPPDKEARVAILRFHLRERPLGEIDLDELATLTDLFSGADLAHLCESAAESALEESIASGTPRPIEMMDFERALEEVRPSTLPWLHTARNFAEFAGEGGYDDLLAYLRDRHLA